MKKFIASFILFFSVFSLSFADNFLSHRYFEIKVDTPFLFSNNTMMLSDFFQEQLVIDLAKIADSIPDDGFNISSKASPSVAITINLKNGPKIGYLSGIDFYGSMGISKSLFEFLGYGNELNETINFSTNAYMDMFVYSSVQLGWNSRKYKFCVTPTLFSSVMHVSANKIQATIQNTPEGKVILNTEGSFDIYSPVAVTETTGFQRMINELTSNFTSSMGFDVEAEFSYGIFDFLDIGGMIRIPMVPSTMSKKVAYDFTYGLETDINSLLNGELPEIEMDETFGYAQKGKYTINRPMKIKATAVAKPFGDFFNAYGQFGIAVRSPGAENKDDISSYPEYLLGCKLSLANLLSLYLSTEYTDQLFTHKASLSLNFRVIEVVTGIATSSASFAKTFQGTGFGAFVTVYMGF